MLSAPWRITLDTNPDDCNLKCVMCDRHSPYSTVPVPEPKARRRMPPEVFRALFGELAGGPFRELVTTSMGEPLLYEHMEEIVELCRRQGVRLNLTTNGTFPRGGAEWWARRLVAAGADIKISLNAGSRDALGSIETGADLDRILDNIRTLVALRDAAPGSGKERSRITIKVTFLEATVTQLPELVELAGSLGVDRVRGSHLLSVFPQTDSLSLARTPDSRSRFNSLIGRAHEVARRIAAARGRPFELSNFLPFGAETRRRPCPFLGQEAWIAPDGAFQPCCIPESLRAGLGEFGRVTEGGLLPIWRGAPYRQFLAGYEGNPLCRDCGKRRAGLQEDQAPPEAYEK